MSLPADPLQQRLLISEIAELVGVAGGTASNWTKRKLGFPDGESVGKERLYAAHEVADWLDIRSVPARYRRPGERDDATYGARFRRALAERAPRSDLRDVDPGTKNCLPALKTLWHRGFRFHRVSEADYYDAALLLAFTWICAPEQWHQIEQAAASAMPHRSVKGLLSVVAGGIDLAMRGRGLTPAAGPVIMRLEHGSIAGVRELIGLCTQVGVRGFGALLHEFARPAARSDTYHTPPEIAALLGACAVAPGATLASIIDPCTRYGELILAVPGAVTDSVTITGICTDHAAARRANMNLIVHGTPAAVSVGPAQPWRRRDTGRFDAVVANPAFNIGSAGSNTKVDWHFGIAPPPHNDNYAWVQSAIAMTSDSGRAAILMPAAAGASANPSEHKLRMAMVESGAVCAIIHLPSALFPASAVDTAVWVLRHQTEDRPAEDRRILFVDALPMITRRHTGALPQLDHGERIAELVRDPQSIAGKGVADLPSGGRAVLVSAEAVAAADYSLIPEEYLISAPSEAETYRSRAEEHQEEIAERLASIDLGKWSRLRFGKLALEGSGLPAGWQRRPLSEVCTIQPGPSGSYGPLMRITDSGTVTVIRPKNIGTRRFKKSDLGKTGPVPAKLEPYRTAENDIVCVRTGTVGHYALVTAEERGWLLNPNVTRLRPDSEKVDPAYLFEYLVWSSARVEKQAAVRSIPSIGSQALGRIEIAVPPIEEQQRIATLLRELNDTIEDLGGMMSAMKGLHAALSDGLLDGRLGAITSP
ncbi:N-6 DNA methylase [Nocardia cyriacigeorgica]|nr:N-6 DNA methylase [Nocardia cyriacigeorgica]